MKQRLVTGGLTTCLTWLQAWWGGKRQASEVVRQYQVFQQNCPLALADLLRFALAFDNTIDEDSQSRTAYNQGRREVALYLMQMMKLTPDDLALLEEQTEATDV